MQSDTISKLVTALVAAQLEMAPAAKNKKNPFFDSDYADLEAVIEASRVLATHGIAVTQPPRVTPDDGKLVLETQLSHVSGEWMRGEYPVNPVKSDPQSLGSAVTYARRYALQAMINQATANDDDGHKASEKDLPDVKHIPTDKQIHEMAEPSYLREETLGLDADPLCPQCGTIMKPGKNGKPYCYPCWLKWKEGQARR